MNGNLLQLSDDLRLHLYRLQVSLNNINGLLAGGTIANPVEFTSRLDALHGMTEAGPEHAAELRDALQRGIEHEATLAPKTVSRWIGMRQTAQLHARADQIERLATVAVELAALASLEAERLTMAAVLARREAISVQVQRDDRD